MQVAYAALRLLADGKFHSGTALAEQLKISRSSVWKAMDFLKSLEIPLQAVSGRGYRWVNPVELLNKSEIINQLSQKAHQAFKRIDVVNVIPSTNDYLIQRLAHDIPSGSVCIAEAQTAGRGRMGRTWQSPFGAHMYLSFYWRFPCKLHNLSGLSLVIGLSVIQALQEQLLLPEGIGIKWPNDIWFGAKKLCGILIETMSNAASNLNEDVSDVVIGIGMNVKTPTPLTQEQNWTDLYSVCGVALSRNQLIASVLNTLVPMLACFQEEGFSAFAQLWAKYDLLYDKKIELSTPKQKQQGIAQGVNERGELCVKIGDSLKAIRYGEISVRPEIDHSQ